MNATEHRELRQLLDDYLEMYASRDDRLTARFSDDFSGFTGGGDRLVHDKDEWIAITRQDFAQVKERIRIELKDVSIQSLTETIAVATSFFTIHLPIQDDVLSRETARLVLIFRREAPEGAPSAWKICHSGISIPYHLVREGEIYPLRELLTRNQELGQTVAERTLQLEEANESLRRANEALQASEARYRSIVNASPDDITITDPQGRIVMVSPMALTMFGYTGSETFLGRPLTDFLVPEDRPRAAAQIALKVAGAVTGPSEYLALRPDGSTFDLEVNSEFMRDANGALTGMVVIARDISERKRAQQDREKLESQHQKVQRAESLGRMAGAIAHHFNNSLHAVSLSVELALAELEAGEVAAEHLIEALASARKAAEVSRSMLTYLGQSGGGREPLDLAEACQRSVSLLRAVLPKDLTLQADVTGPGPRVRASVSDLQQAVGNLVTNAAEAMTPGQGTIRVALRVVAAEDVPSRHRFPLGCTLTHPSYACLEVSDSGSGIAAHDIDNLFEPFFSTKFTGRGLGLPVALGIVRAHEGVITVTSEPGRGSSFCVYLPASTEPMAEALRVLPEPSSPTARRTVLVVDDEPAVLRVAARALGRRGFDVLTAGDGVEAMAILSANRAVVGCVVCDVTMPRMNGWDTLSAIRALAPTLPVILASGYGEAQVMAGEHPEKPDAFLSKPYDLQTLVGALDRAFSAARAVTRA